MIVNSLGFGLLVRVLFYSFLIQQIPRETKTNNEPLHVSILPDFLTVALSHKCTGSYWRPTSSKTGHKQIASFPKTAVVFNQTLLKQVH